MALSSLPVPVRVTLRPATPADAPALAAWRAEPSVRLHQPLQEASVADLRADLGRQRPADLYRARGDRFQWIVLAEREPVGWITLAITSWEQGVAEVGYALTSAAQGHGIMPVALTQLVAELFGNTPLARIEARCSVENLASQKVLERVGFEREGRLRRYFELAGRRLDNFLYAIVREDVFAAPL